MSLLKTVRKTYDQTGNNNVGPTADNTSKIALSKKVQLRTGYGNQKTVQLWGLNNNDAAGATDGNKSGVSGDSGTRTYFSGIFPRMSF